MKGCRPLDDDEIKQVANTLAGRYALRDRALFLLGVKSGFRISELLSLRVGDVIQAGRVVDRVTVARRHMKKKAEGRTVLLHPAAGDALSAWLEVLGRRMPVTASTPVFLSREGAHSPLSRYRAWQILKAAYRRCGLTGKLGTHSLRKTFASRVYEGLKHDLVLVQKALGHRNIASTISYLGFNEQAIDQAILAA